jgi:hypothetical protein
MTLYRPVGVAELALIISADWRAFPPRLPSQPIFYPVLTRDYAVKIARDWNTKDPNSGYAGFVLRFEVDDAYAAQFEVQEVGGRACRELWVPAEQLAEFNSHIVGRIEAVEAFVGS